MKQFDATLVDALEKRVAEVEDDNDIEVVVRVSPYSGHYRDVPWIWGVGVALLVLLFATYSSVQVDPAFLPLELCLIGLLAGWLGRRFIPLTRFATSAERRLDQTHEAAFSCFVEQAVGATRSRTGVLVYVSLLEDLVWVIPDHGAAGAAALAEWDGLSKLGRDRTRDIVERLNAVLDGIEVLGDKALPASRGDNPDELPNRPVIGHKSSPEKPGRTS